MMKYFRFVGGLFLSYSSAASHAAINVTDPGYGNIEVAANGSICPLFSNLTLATLSGEKFPENLVNRGGSVVPKPSNDNEQGSSDAKDHTLGCIRDYMATLQSGLFELVIKSLGLCGYVSPVAFECAFIAAESILLSAIMMYTFITSWPGLSGGSHKKSSS